MRMMEATEEKEHQEEPREVESFTELLRAAIAFAAPQGFLVFQGLVLAVMDQVWKVKVLPAEPAGMEDREAEAVCISPVGQ